MKTIYCFSLIALAVCICFVKGNEKRQLIGICVEACSPHATTSQLLNTLGGIQACADGMECVSNGCGHVCRQKNIFKSTPSTCLGVMCAMFCENGFQKGDDGCPICKCNDAVIG